MRTEAVLHAASWDDLLETLEAERSSRRLRGREGRSRLEAVLDDGAPFDELAEYAGDGFYDGELAEAADRLVTGIGRVSDRAVMAIAAGDDRPEAPLPPTLIRKIDRAQQIALENRLPVAYLVGSSGRFVATGEEHFPDQNDWGNLTVNASKLRAAGIFQTAVSFGPMSLNGPLAIFPVDTAVLAPGSKTVRKDWPEATSVVAGGDGDEWVTAVRDAFVVSPAAPEAPFARIESRPPARDPRTLYDLMPLDPSYEYETRDVLDRLVDGDSFVEYKQEYGRTLVCGYARIDGWPVGVIGNQKRHVQAPGRPIEVGGVIYPESADKGARFVMDCNQNRLPLVFLQDVNGFMVGREVEVAGIIRSGAKLVNAVANTVVPKLTVILGGSYGAGNYALCGRGYSPRLLLAWPTCRYGVMGGSQAARTLLSLRVRQLQRDGQEPDEETLKALGREIQDSYDEQLDPRYAAARLWVDAVIAPHETRQLLSRALAVTALNDRLGTFKTGVLQV